jgi:hypothetical protein
MRWLIAAAFSVLLTACATPHPLPRSTSCQSGEILLDSHFENGQIGHCQPQADGRFLLTLLPEDEPPIIDSPWYAMRLSGAPGARVSIEMAVEGGHARYWPKISTDGLFWERLPESAVSFAVNGRTMRAEFELPAHISWLAGQELLASAYYEQWTRELAELPFASTRLAGRSREGRALFFTQTEARREAVLLIGRQHPPELTGAISMRPFVDTVLGESELARQFRERFQVVVFPILNPDGVARGHWRHNTGGTDLNRDWGPFTQPETQLVRRWLDDFDRGHQQLRLMLDFHSTRQNLFYTQVPAEVTDPPEFATRWLQASAARLPEYVFKHDARPVSEQPNTKNYFFTTYGIPAITYETGDETPREEVRQSAVIFAEEMMKLLLSYPPPTN